MRTVVVLQARTASTRLPGKALLPLAGYPTAVLAALRAANLQDEIIVATSDQPSDDKLSEQLGTFGVRVVRGPLDDVLGRFHLAVSRVPDDATIIRLTGDNVVPDGTFIRELAQAFSESAVEYLSQSSPQSKLPYGLGGEAFSAGTLRRAHAEATSAYDREHVGPWMSRNCRSAVHVPASLGGQDFSHLRCTLDDEEDYERLRRLFDGIADPVRAGWKELVNKLAGLPGEPSFRVPYRVHDGHVHSEVALGTVQLGTEYGIVNRTGQPSEQQAIAIVRQAIAHGVTSIDTARGYGSAESVLGKALAGAWRSRVEVVTKLDPLPSVSRDATAEEVRAVVDDSVSRSCSALGTNRLSTVLLHRWNHYRDWNGAAWNRLLELRDQGRIGRLGVSVYSPIEALDALQDPDVQHIQLPVNALDRRWKKAGVDRAVAVRSDVVVHARSVFLQGLLLSPPESWPDAEFDARSASRQLQSLTRRFERESIADLCLAYVRSLGWVRAAVVGCETTSQLQQNLELCCHPKLTVAQVEELEDALPNAPEGLLNPSQWKLVHG